MKEGEEITCIHNITAGTNDLESEKENNSLDVNGDLSSAFCAFSTQQLYPRTSLCLSDFLHRQQLSLADLSV